MRTTIILILFVCTTQISLLGASARAAYCSHLFESVASRTPKVARYSQVVIKIDGIEKRIAIVNQKDFDDFSKKTSASKPILFTLDNRTIPTAGTKILSLIERAFHLAARWSMSTMFGKNVLKEYKFEVDESNISSYQIREIAQKLLDSGENNFSDINVRLGGTKISGEVFEELVEEATRHDFIKINVDRNFNRSGRGKIINIMYSLNRAVFWGSLALFFAPESAQIQSQIVELGQMGLIVTGGASFIGSAAKAFEDASPWIKRITYFMPNLSALTEIAGSRAATLERTRLIDVALQRAANEYPEWRDMVIVTENQEQADIIYRLMKAHQ